jgi:organic radical activating enzyme
MKMWGPQLKYLIDIIITGSYAYPDIAQRYISDKLQDVKYEIEIESNYPLPEDETEEKQNDLAEVTAQTMSRKSYMKKWRKLTDSESDEELQQIAVENELLNNSFSNSFNQDQTGTDNQDNTDNQNDVNNSNQDNVNNNIKDGLQQ